MANLNAGLSDLFFNHEKTELNRLYEAADGDGIDPADEAAALELAAEEFSSMVDAAFGVDIDPIDLVNDFKRRL